jgi:cytochrome P450
MTDSDMSLLEPARLRELFDLRGSVYASRGGAFEDDIYPAFHRLRETGPVHPGIVGPLVGFHGDAFFQGLPFPDRPHFSVFDYATCDAVLRDSATYSSTEHPPGSDAALNEKMILNMDGTRHRRYRTLVQPSFVPKKAQWWIAQWIDSTVHALIDAFEPNGRADLNVEFCAAIPLLTITGSFGVSLPLALDIRAAVTADGLGLGTFIDIVQPIIEARRLEARDDLISVLVHSEVQDEAGEVHVLSDDEILGFAFLLLAAGSGTTWKQMGIALTALLSHPEWLLASKNDPAVLRASIEESLRWTPTDPMFARFATRDTTLGGFDVPAGSPIHLCFGAANRDPLRWDRPDEFDPGRPMQAHLGFGGGPHICLGMHVARAEMQTAIAALLARLPNLRPDPEAETPRIIGMYERGPTSVPVVFG